MAYKLTTVPTRLTDGSIVYDVQLSDTSWGENPPTFVFAAVDKAAAAAFAETFKRIVTDHTVEVVVSL